MNDVSAFKRRLSCMETELITTGLGGTVRPLKVEELSEWESLVRQSAQGTLFHSRLWLDALGEPYKLFGWFTGGQLRGGFAVGIVGPRAASAPYSALTPYLGLLLPEGDTKYVTRLSTEKQISEAFAVFLKREFNSIQFRFPPEIIDLQPFIWEGFQVGVRYTYRLGLQDVATVLANMHKRCRRDLRAAEKQGIRIETDVPFTQVLPLCEMSLKRRGLATSLLTAAERVEAVLRQAGFLARSRQETPIGAVWIVWDEKRAYYLLGGYSDPAKSGNAVALALWHAIQFTAVDLGLSEFDFEGSMIPLIELFFRKFGGTIKPTYTISYEKRISLLRRLWNRTLQHLRED
jgi:Acetyltransferase (GNAT) domain